MGGWEGIWTYLSGLMDFSSFYRTLRIWQANPQTELRSVKYPFKYAPKKVEGSQLKLK